MIVVADTGPINYLILIGEIEVLPILYGAVIIPPIVREELARNRAPEIVRRWINSQPIWLEVRQPAIAPDAELIASELDEGELDAILLAQELGASELILDDMDGRKEAARRHMHAIGTLGVLRLAAKRRLLNLQTALTLLRATNFYIDQKLFDQLIAESGQ